METVARLLDVIEHPYFSKHVTTLLYDASYYDEDKANDAESYATAARKAPVIWKQDDGSRLATAYLALWDRLRVGVSEHFREVIENLGPAACRFIEPEGYLGLSHYRGFFEYAEAYRAQRELQESPLPKCVLEQVFA